MRIIICILGLLSIVCGQIAFPVVMEPVAENTESERIPLYAPDKCTDPNELLYPGNQQSDWICDCTPGYIYYPPKTGCFAAYREGPCKKGEHLMLKKDKVIPECVKNPCQDGFARYNGQCYELGKPNGPCRPELEGGGIFDVNATTLEVECLKGMDKISLLYEKMSKGLSLPNNKITCKD